jgi:hypothetical protein
MNLTSAQFPLDGFARLKHLRIGLRKGRNGGEQSQHDDLQNCEKG